jgi:hypothetical protein
MCREKSAKLGALQAASHPALGSLEERLSLLCYNIGWSAQKKVMRVLLDAHDTIIRRGWAPKSGTG